MHTEASGCQVHDGYALQADQVCMKGMSDVHAEAMKTNQAESIPKARRVLAYYTHC